MKILHFSPVKKENEIVNLHLKSLRDLKFSEEVTLTFSFFDDNIDPKSSSLINKFVKEKTNSILFSKKEIGLSLSKKSEKRWEKELYSRITIIKDYVINYFKASDYDFLFLTDSDLILHPNTLNSLISAKKNFCAEIFWTHFDNGKTYTPNCWYSKLHGFNKLDLMKFRQKGVYEVDYTGACTLLSKKIINSGVRFEKISNVSYLGEDKHFCIRASVLDFKIYVDTNYPAFHLYNNQLINQGMEFVKSNYDLTYLNFWLNEDWKNSIENIGKNVKINLLKRIFVKLFKKKFL